MIASLYTITAQTNLHPGSGDANYGIIDKLVQRDPVSGLPVIHASSLKGAILQHISKKNDVTDDYIDEVFGRQVNTRWKSNRTVDGGKTGKFLFMQANLLSIPVRSNSRPFFRISGSSVLSELLQQLIYQGLVNESHWLAVALNTLAAESEIKPIVLDQALEGSHHFEDKRDLKCEKSSLSDNIDKLEELFGGNNLVIMPDDIFRHLTDNHHLPVIARNHLENGQSTNLWYEQVLPRQTCFSFTMQSPSSQEHAGDFDARLTGEGLVQIGANATVGYGYCKISNCQTILDHDTQPEES